MNISIPDYVNKTLYSIKEFGCEAYIVGGCVRDLIIGRIPSDYDVTTSAKPEEIQEIFKDYKTLEIGKEYGTIVVVLEEGNIEITTYRTDGEYKDGRRPSEVSFADNIVDDLSRRDFTINSLAYNSDSGLIDPFNGLDDLQQKRIKSVGDPIKRLKEDYLRILRAVRFATQLDFTIEENTYNACKELNDSLKYISAERIRDELFKILLSMNPSKGIRLMYEMEILKNVIPELIETVDYDQRNPNHTRILFDHILCVLDNTPPKLDLRMAALLHDIAKPMTFSLDEKGIGHYIGHDKIGADVSKEILIRLKCSKDFIEKVSMYIREHMYHGNMKQKGLKRELSRVGKENIFDLYELKRADMMCKSDDKDLSLIDERIKQIEEILEKGEPYNKNQLKIDGNDIIALGFPKGKTIGEILNYLMDKVIEHPEYNSKEKLIELIENKFQLTNEN
ncbi:HD domain-containing protein [Tissierella sp. Yu-01]|uniref:CCA tRNA nucleotidyltransferase n=1 Tax=Tissierella sp. Yu-01 TaxID=3035694 RepID=UPI00240E86A3|nr:HD domain-containing protein [Tissierella sp. Yu-01]WFA10292.1 HD domain-containing protein [Tissierella sp. Yu-01]